MGSQHGDELHLNTMRDGWTEQYSEEEAQFSVSCSSLGRWLQVGVLCQGWWSPSQKKRVRALLGAKAE